MPKHILALDCNYLCYRAFYAIPGLTHEEVPTSVPFGVFSEIERLRDKWPKAVFVFCFDRGKGCRKALDPGYNSDREEKRAAASEEDRLSYESVKTQTRRLEHEWLPQAGFRNIVAQQDYEADDMIAGVCRDKQKEDRVTIIGTDKDLWQLLSPTVRIWNPQTKSILTKKAFESEWGISPTQWADVKALAGCNSDSVEGLRGVGEKLAARFLNGSLGTHTVAYGKCATARDMWEHNLKLVRLPFPGTKVPPIKEDEVTKKSWLKVTKQLGMASFRERGLVRDL